MSQSFNCNVISPLKLLSFFCYWISFYRTAIFTWFYKRIRGSKSEAFKDNEILWITATISRDDHSQKVGPSFDAAIILRTPPLKEDFFFNFSENNSNNKFNQRSISNRNVSSGRAVPHKRWTLVPSTCWPKSQGLQTPITWEPSSAQPQKPLVKSSMKPTSRERRGKFTLSQIMTQQML